MEASGDYYAILGVESGADDAAIRLAYRKLMRRYHPDVNRSDDAAAQAKSINEAYACLKDPDERAAYDRQRAGPQPQPQPRPRPSRPYSTQTGTGPRRNPYRQRPQPRAYEVEVEPPPPRMRFVIFGLAALVTFLSFAFTAATPPPEPVPAVVTVDGAIGADCVKGEPCPPSEAAVRR